MNRKQKNQLKKIILAGIILSGAILAEAIEDIPNILSIILFGAAYVTIGLETVLKAFRNLFRGQVFDENFLMSIATVGALALGEFAEANAVMIFFQLGELFESCAVDRSRKSISELMDIRPDYANLIRNGEEITADPYDVQIGDIIIIRSGEKVPMDGRIIEGSTSVDTAALTGEAAPRYISEGDEIISGCINLTGVIKVQVTKEFHESTVSKILDLVENASSKKAPMEKFITRFARIYTPAVCLSALLIAVIPPIIIEGASFGDWVYRALTFLVISCPCALVISVPLSFFGGIGGAGKLGILVKGSNYLEALGRIETVVFDKTGTLTTGDFEIAEIRPEEGYNEEELLELAAYAESYSHHPVSKAIVNAFPGQIDFEKVVDVMEAAGRGVETSIIYKGREITIHAGNEKLMWDVGLYDVPSIDSTAVYVAIDGSFAGYIVFEDKIKPDAAKTIQTLTDMGIKNTIMLSGDREQEAIRVGNSLKIGKVFGGLLPQDKVYRIEQLMKEKEGKKSLIFVGDGINDAPSLARADVGVAMGGLGQDAAIEAADVVIMTDEPARLITAIKIAKRTNIIAKQNVVFSLGIKFAVLLLALLGIASMWAAIFADVGVAVLAILNSIRALNVKGL